MTLFCNNWVFFRNLNPFEVLQVDPDLGIDEIKKKFRVRLSEYLIPFDKNY